LGTVLLIPAVWLVTTYRATPWNVLLVEYDALLLLGSLTYLWSVWLGTKRR
jgi:hypothetical protein